MHPCGNEDTRDWMALSFVTEIGSRTAALLIDRFGSPSACFKASPRVLETCGLSKASVAMLKSGGPRSKAEKDLEKLEQLGAEVITLNDPRYPVLLRETYDPPILLYVLGDIDLALSQPVVAIVGSRRCSAYGRNVGEMLARELAGRGVTVVSGLARGIDRAAHAGALAGRGLTIAVMGTGADAIYPREHEQLARRIAEAGALLTEFPLGTPPLSQNFPFRNRVISGIGLGVLVVEGAERSGSLITARLAYEQGREVFAVPGNITSPKSFGPNYLIQDGAKLVQTWRDIVEEFPQSVRAAILAAETTSKRQGEQLMIDEVVLSAFERRVLAFLTVDEPIHVDQLISRTALGFGELMAALLKLEMIDRIRQLPGKTFVRKL